MSESVTPLVVGIGGTMGGRSSTERALALALRGAGATGIRTRLFGGEFLSRLPLYNPKSIRTPDEQEFICNVRQASGVIVASPAYHGGVSGLVKNALDLLEETAKDARPYLSDLPVGVVVTAYGWQAIGSTVTALRTIIHALRGWPTPYAAGVNSMNCRFDETSGCSDSDMERRILRVGEQVGQTVGKSFIAVGLGTKSAANVHAHLSSRL